MKLNKFVKFPLVLGIVGTICAGALGVVYEVTNPIIQDRINAEANAGGIRGRILYGGSFLVYVVDICSVGYY